MNLFQRIKTLPPDVQYIIYNNDTTYKTFFNRVLIDMKKNTRRWRTNFRLLSADSQEYIYRKIENGYKETYEKVKERCDKLNDGEMELRRRYECKYWTYSYYYPLYEFNNESSIPTYYRHPNINAIPPNTP